MIRWTKSARQTFVLYEEEARRNAMGMGGDPDEIAADLRAHVEEEAARKELPTLTEGDLTAILASMGCPEPEPQRDKQKKRRAKKQGPALPGPFSMMAGVVLPSLVILIEAVSGMCAEEFFDPLPTRWHLLATACVPLANLIVWTSLHRGKPVLGRRLKRLRWVNGFAIGVAALYALAFAPLIPLGLFALILFGMGLLPMAPAFSALAAVSLHRKMRALAPDAPRSWGTLGGLAMAALTLSLPEAGSILTDRGLTMAASEDEATRTRGISLLRSWGSEKHLLDACYEARSGPGLLFSLVFNRRATRVDPLSAQRTFYRVTGEDFTARPRPKSRDERWGDRWLWDSNQGSSTIGPIIEGLSLVESRIDGSVDANAGLAYLEWTMVFGNSYWDAREARAEISLPIGAVVSRATLWIDDEEREAAYAGTRDVREAYQSVVFRQRDPLLVTHRAPGKILLQCFPVPSLGRMKVRVGITAPLELDSLDAANLMLPCITEGNFRRATEHSVWIEAKTPIQSSPPLAVETIPEGGFALRGELMEDSSRRTPSVVHLEREPTVNNVWSADPVNESTAIRQALVFHEPSWPQRVVCVVDTSASMSSSPEILCRWLEQVPRSVELGLILAGDEPSVLLEPDASARAKAEALVELSSLKFSGGANDVPAIALAWDRAASAEDGVVLWFHGPKPVPLDGVQGLVQRNERRPAGPSLHSVQLIPGPNRILQDSSASNLITSLSPRTLDGTVWPARVSVERVVTTRAEVQTTPEPKTSDHLARLWALDRTTELLRAGDREGAISMASSYRLITPVTGAVVLESQRQYDAAGLTPVAPGTVPSIPEPSFYVLVAAIALLLVVYRKRLSPAAS